MSDEASFSPTAEPLSDDVRHDQYLSERYGAQPRPDDLEWTPAVETMLAHRSVRAFTPTPLTERELTTVIAAAQSAPTSSNLHLWSVIVIDDDALRARIMDLADSPNQSENFAFMRQAPTVLLWVADASRNEEIMAAAGADTGTLDYLDSFLTVSVDAAMAAQNAVVAAESMGLGTCYLGSMRNLEAALCDLLGLPPHSYVVVGLALGHPAPQRLGGGPPPARAGRRCAAQPRSRASAGVLVASLRGGLRRVPRLAGTGWALLARGGAAGIEPHVHGRPRRDARRRREAGIRPRLSAEGRAGALSDGGSA